MAKKNDPIHGAMTCAGYPTEGNFNGEPMGSYSRDRDPARRQRIPEFPNWSVTDGSGLRRSFSLFPDSSLSRFIPDTQRASSMATITCSRGRPRGHGSAGLLRRSFFATGSGHNYPYVYAGFRCVED